MNQIKKLLLLIPITLIWILLWVLISTFTGYFLATTFNISDALSIKQCGLINAARSVSYLILLLGQLMIFKYVLKANSLKSTFNIQGITHSFRSIKSISIYETAKLILINISWLIYWTFLSSLIFFFSVSHFMGDCDNSDMECSCNHLAFLFPVFVITVILGVLYLSKTYLDKANEKT